MGDHCYDDDTPPLRRPRRTTPRGVPIVTEDVTPVFDLLERELAAPEHEVIRRSQRAGGDPATYADLVKLARELAGERRARRASEQTPGLTERLAELERHVLTHRRLVRWAAAGAAASILAVASFVYSRGVTEGGAAVRLERLEHEVDALRSRELDRHAQASPAVEPVATIKDQIK